MPTGGEWSGFGFAIAHHATSHKIGIVEYRSVSMHQCIAQFSAFMDGTRCLGCVVAGNASRKRELLEQLFHTFFVLLNAGIELRVRTFKIGVRHHAGPAMSRPADVNNVEIVLRDQAVEVHIDKVQSRRRTPMTKQPRFHMLKLQRLTHQGVRVQVDLSNREIIGRAPISVHLAQLFWREWLVRCGNTGRIGRCQRRHTSSFS